MPTDIRIFHLPEILQSDSRGAPDFEATLQHLRLLAERCEMLNIDHILLDVREADGRNLSVADVYSIACQFRDLGLRPNHKLAIVNKPKDDFDRAAFLTLCAGNRGWNVRAFRQIEPALQWLAVA